MTQDATTPSHAAPSALESLRITLHNLMHPTPPATLTGTITFHESGNASMREGSFYNRLYKLEAEGNALLQSGEHAVEAVGHTIWAIGEHNVHPAAAAIAPRDVETARALPLARAGDILHESEHAIVRAFMDAENVLRNVYLNVHGLWVKA